MQLTIATPEQMEELCSPDLQAVGADAGRELAPQG